MRKITAFVILVLLFFFSLLPEYSILEIGRQLGENEVVATLIIQVLLVIVIVLAIVFTYFNLSLPKKQERRRNEKDL